MSMMVHASSERHHCAPNTFVIVKEGNKFLAVFIAILGNRQAEHLVRKGRPLVQQESLDMDAPEVRSSKRSTMELLEAERLDDLETCMVSISPRGCDPEARGETSWKNPSSCVEVLRFNL